MSKPVLPPLPPVPAVAWEPMVPKVDALCQWAIDYALAAIAQNATPAQGEPVDYDSLSYEQFESMLRKLGPFGARAADSIAYLSAQENLLDDAQTTAERLASELAETKRPLDAEMARLNQSVIVANQRATEAVLELTAARFRIAELEAPQGEPVDERKAFEDWAERDLITLFYSLKPDKQQERALTRTVWKDGIDLELSNLFLTSLAEAIWNARAALHPAPSSTQEDEPRLVSYGLNMETCTLNYGGKSYNYDYRDRGDMQEEVAQAYAAKESLETSKNF